MTDCDRTAERLAAYADGSLPPPEWADVDRHLQACPPCRKAASQEHGACSLVRARAAELRAQPLPPGLRSRCEALAREHARNPVSRWRARLVPVAATAIVLVFAGTAILSLATRRSNTLLAAQLTADHSRCFSQFVTPDARGLDAREVEADLANRFGWDLHVPPGVDAEGVRLVHARRCLYADGRIPHILYRVNGHDVSLFMIEGVARGEAEVTAFGHRSRIWTRGGTTFVLVASEGAGELASLVRYVRQQAR
ncbi:MAG: zf-HC2 domain-containing protein [Acidobacteria bacterium]|nr:zf-HC2 domain-containing protein [Acidobacteriota bacterium]